MIRHLFLFFALTGISAFSQDHAQLAGNDAAFDTLAIQHRGRIKPFLSFAQEMTTSISGRSFVSIPDIGKIGSRQLILSLWLNPVGWENEPILLVDDPALRRELSLPGDTRLFSPRRLAGIAKLTELSRQAELSRASGARAETLPLPAAAQSVATTIITASLANRVIGIQEPTPVPSASTDGDASAVPASTHSRSGPRSSSDTPPAPDSGDPAGRGLDPPGADTTPFRTASPPERRDPRPRPSAGFDIGPRSFCGRGPVFK